MINLAETKTIIKVKFQTLTNIVETGTMVYRRFMASMEIHLVMSFMTLWTMLVTTICQLVLVMYNRKILVF